MDHLTKMRTYEHNQDEHNHGIATSVTAQSNEFWSCIYGYCPIQVKPGSIHRRWMDPSAQHCMTCMNWITRAVGPRRVRSSDSVELGPRCIRSFLNFCLLRFLRLFGPRRVRSSKRKKWAPLEYEYIYIYVRMYMQLYSIRQLAIGHTVTEPRAIAHRSYINT